MALHPRIRKSRPKKPTPLQKAGVKCYRCKQQATSILANRPRCAYHTKLYKEKL